MVTIQGQPISQKLRYKGVYFENMIPYTFQIDFSTPHQLLIDGISIYFLKDEPENLTEAIKEIEKVFFTKILNLEVA